MRAVLLAAAAGLAAISIPAAPVQAQGQFVSGSGGHSGRFDSPRFVDDSFQCGFGGRGVIDRRDRRDDGDRRGRRDRRGDDRVVCDVFVPGWYGGEWALYNNRSFEPDSYNDWWHDRPDRSMPRWVQNNQNCQRMWWGGGGWRC